MKINAYAFTQPGGSAAPFVYERNVRKNEVLVRITHCGIATGDIQIIQNDWGDTKFPLVPGHEIIGTIEKIGSSVNDEDPQLARVFRPKGGRLVPTMQPVSRLAYNLTVGDRVGIGYQQEACFQCQYCKEGNEQFCPKQKVIGVDCYGGLAEHIIVDSRFAFKLPKKLDSAKSVPLLSSGVTVYTGITRAQLPKNAVVAVLGVGGLGQLAIQFLQKMGHNVSAFSHSPEKKKMINQLGAEYVDSANPNTAADHHRKFDFILSTLNVDFDLNAYLKMLTPQGKFCLVSQPLNTLSISAGILYDYAQRTLYGNYTGSRKDMRAMLTFSAKHAIESFVEVMPFSAMHDAIEVVKTGKATKRIVLGSIG
jgi:D-arabinose 1-dehydrogenase-like Zn-dependent alcohol dehydrogenase